MVACGRLPNDGSSDPPEASAGHEIERAAEAPIGIRGEAIREHMRILAADEMEGRETGTPGYDLAADYVAGQFEAIGLEPFGDRDSYFQEIDFLETRVVPESAAVRFERRGDVRDLVFPEDFVRWGSFGAARESVTAPLMFVGYGVTAPEYSHDDYADLDLNGRIAVVLTGAPPGFETDQRAYHSASSVKRRLAAAAGAVGVLRVRTPVDQRRLPWTLFESWVDSPDMGWIEGHGGVHGAFAELVGSATLSETGARKLFDLAGHDLERIFERREAGQTGGLDLGVTATVVGASRQRRISSANVVGLLEGSDPELRDQYVVYTAHLDHLGQNDSDTGREIYNGAYDNAAGVGIILETARVLAALDEAPRRSIIFLAVTAEEVGLRGSSYFANNPPVPIAQIVANLNVDMPFLGFPIAEVEAFGAEHSTLRRSVQRAAHEVGLVLVPDSMPEQVRFVRSDQFSFVQQGVPALAFKPGLHSSDPALDGPALVDEFLSTHYHRPSDDLSLPFDARSAERFARVVLGTGLLVANDRERPRWNDGDFFGETFDRDRDR